jgi:multidrug efflux pump
LIPVLTIPISMIGVFFFTWYLGFSLNVLTLLAVVLAIGIVVDDAIVVLENIYSKIEKGIPPKRAAIDGLKEIFMAVIATSLVLCAVFTPLLFIDGFTGLLFREFGFVIAVSVLISSFVALTLAGMLSSRLLKNREKKNRFYLATEPFLKNEFRLYETFKSHDSSTNFGCFNCIHLYGIYNCFVSSHTFRIGANGGSFFY